MYFKKFIALMALLIGLTANAAHADIQIWAFVDNQTSSAILLNGAETSGTFNTGPVTSVAANTRTLVAATFTFGFSEEGIVSYGPCDMEWDVSSIFGFYDFFSSVFASGTGCTATVLGEIYFTPSSIVVAVELDIT